jgi:uncharacterized protein
MMKIVARFYALAFCFAWLMWIPAAIFSRRLTATTIPIMPLILLGTFGPLISATWMTWTERTEQGPLDLLKSGFRWRFSWQIYAVVMLLPAVIAGAAYYFAGGRSPNAVPSTIVATFVLYFFLGGSFAEEFGWRGFALPRLQLQFGWKLGSLIVGAIWAIWHLPLFWVKGTTQNQTPFLLFAVSCLAMSLIMAWAYNRADGSVLTALLFHTSWNTMSVVCPPVPSKIGTDLSAGWSTAGFAVVAVVLVLLGNLRQH